MQKGSTLLEILIAMSIFSMAVLPLARLQWVSYQQLKEALECTEVTQLAEDLVAKVRTSKTNSASGEIKKGLLNFQWDSKPDGEFFRLILRWHGRYSNKPSSFEVVFVR